MEGRETVTMSGSVEQDTRSRYETVCAELNMDEHTAGSAWTSYGEINNDYVLEVSQANELREVDE